MDQAAEQVYQSVLAIPHATVAEVASRLRMPESTVSERLAGLHELGVVQPSQVAAAGWRAVNPALAMGRRIAEQEQSVARQLDAIAERRVELHRLVDVYGHGSNDRDAIVRIADRDDVLAHLSDLVSTARREVAAFVTNRPSAAALEQSRDLDAHLLARGVRLRTICLDIFRRDRGMQKALKSNAAAGAEIRTVPTLPTRMIVFDQREAVIATDPTDPSAGALLVSNHSAVALFVDLFHRYWDHAAPFPDATDAVAGASALSPMERMVIRMLADGQKDESIARATGQSVRTVRRIVSGISARVGARGRFDLALHAADQGWVARPGATSGSEGTNGRSAGSDARE